MFLLETLRKYSCLQVLILVLFVAPPIRNPFEPPRAPSPIPPKEDICRAHQKVNSSSNLRPELKGIIWSSAQPSAFLFWQGRTKRYTLGASLGSYILIKILPKTVVLQQGEVLISLEL